MMRLRRRGGTIARIGGEEFAVILPETDLREAVAALRFDGERRSGYSVTMSFGAAMYAAKRAGRNRVATDGAPFRPSAASPSSASRA